MKRLAAAIIAITTATIGLTACGGSPQPSAGAPADAGSGTGTITFSSHVTGMDKVVAAFNASQSDIKVNFEQTPSPTKGGNAKLTNGIKAGNAPDVATVEYQDLPSFVSQGGIRPIEDISADTLGKLPAGVKSTVTFAGHSWAAPYDVGPMVYYYREDVFAQAGLEAPKTWDDFARAAEVINAKNPGTQIASFWPNESKLFAALSWQAGGKWFAPQGDAWQVNLSDAATQKVANYWQELADKKLVAVQQGFSDEWSAGLQSGKIVGYVGASWGASGLAQRTANSAGKWRVAPLPNWGTPASGTYGGSTFVVTKASKNAKAAATFLQWLTSSPESLKARGELGVTYPAQPALLGDAKSAAAGQLTHFGGQDIYGVFEEQAGAIVEGWTWGPTQVTLTSLSDGLGKVGSGGNIRQALTEAQQATVSQLKNDGISVKG